MTLALLLSHPVQYYSPIIRELARRRPIEVLFAHNPTPEQQGRDGFGQAFSWDVDLTGGFDHRFLNNVALSPDVGRFAGCDTPEIYALLKGGSYSGVLSFGWHLKSYVQGIWAARRLGLPLLVRGDSQLSSPRSAVKKLAKAMLYPALLRIFDAALYVGVRSREYWEHYRYPAGRLIFSPHCVDNQWFEVRATAEAAHRLRADHAIGEAEKLLLFAGKLVEFKRPYDLISAAALMRGRGRPVTVMMAGAGALERQLAAQAEALGVRLILPGFQNQSAMPAIYAAADALVLPSDGGETWGLVANEALASGTPIIVSDACGCAPDLANGPAGASYPVGDIVAMADATLMLLAAQPNRIAMRSLLDRYSIATAVDGIEAALEIAIANKRAGGAAKEFK